MFITIYRKLPYVIIAIVTALYLFLAISRHNHFMTYGYDLGIYDQQVWLYSRFQNPFLTIEYKSALLNHFSPSLALLAPLYWIWSDPRTLLILQALLLGSSAIPLDILAKRKNLPLYLRATLTLSYVTFYAYQFSINYDVHSLVLGTTLIPFFLLTLEDRKYRTAAVLLFIILGTKESFPITMASIGLVYFIKGRKKLGATIVTASVAFLFVSLKVVQPVIMDFTHETYRFAPSTIKNPLDLITNLFNIPSKQEAWTLSFLWYALIPLAAPITLLPVLTDLAFYFIFGNNHPETLTIYNHYRSSLAPLLAWASLEACANIYKYISYKSSFARFSHFVYPALAALLLIACCYFQKIYNLPLNSLTDMQWFNTPQYVKDNNAILQKVPRYSPVAAQNNLSPHLSQRKDIHLLWPTVQNGGNVKFPLCATELKKITLGQEDVITSVDKTCTSHQEVQSPCGKEYCYWIRFHEKDKYLVTDTHPGQNAVQLLMENESKLREGLQNLEKTGYILQIERIGDAQLWEVQVNK